MSSCLGKCALVLGTLFCFACLLLDFCPFCLVFDFVHVRRLFAPCHEPWNYVSADLYLYLPAYLGQVDSFLSFVLWLVARIKVHPSWSVVFPLKLAVLPSLSAARRMAFPKGAEELLFCTSRTADIFNELRKCFLEKDQVWFGHMLETFFFFCVTVAVINAWDIGCLSRGVVESLMYVTVVI